MPFVTTAIAASEASPQASATRRRKGSGRVVVDELEVDAGAARHPVDPTLFADTAAVVPRRWLTVEAARPEPVGLADGYGEVVEREVPCAAGTPLGAVGMTLTLRVGDFGGGAGRSSRPIIPLLDPVEHNAFFVGEGGPRIDACSFGEMAGIPTPSVRWLPAIPVCPLVYWCFLSLGPSRELRLANIEEALTRGPVADQQ